MEGGNFFKFDAQRADDDGFVLRQKPNLVVTVPMEVSANENGCFDCNVCLETAHDPVVTLCGHLFCWPCIYKWLDVQKSSPLSIITQQNCPVCKSNISIGSLVPLYGRGMSSSSSSSSSLEDDAATIIPQRPTSSPLNNLISSASTPNPGFLHHHRAQSPRHYGGGGFTATESSTDLANAVMMSILYPVIGMFGDMVYTRRFGTFTNTLAHPYQDTRFINVNNNQRMVQIDKSLHRVSIFFCCCIFLCLFLF